MRVKVKVVHYQNGLTRCRPNVSWEIQARRNPAGPFVFPKNRKPRLSLPDVRRRGQIQYSARARTAERGDLAGPRFQSVKPRVARMRRSDLAARTAPPT